jgi:gliding motility-associated-like protein
MYLPIHIVFINDKMAAEYYQRNGGGHPKYFTPNNDSYNDGWGIKGMTKYPDATINIFDRYGKQITTLTISNQTWDGTINGTFTHF